MESSNDKNYSSVGALHSYDGAINRTNEKDTQHVTPGLIGYDSTSAFQQCLIDPLHADQVQSNIQHLVS